MATARSTTRLAIPVDSGIAVFFRTRHIALSRTNCTTSIYSLLSRNSGIGPVSVLTAIDRNIYLDNQSLRFLECAGISLLIRQITER